MNSSVAHRSVDTCIVDAGAQPPSSRWTVQATGFETWWREKLSVYRQFLASPVVDIRDPRQLTQDEHRALSTRLDAANMALYRVREGGIMDHESLLELGRQFGLHLAERNLCADEDAISDITVTQDAVRRRYVPYTTRSLSWHTDGYYNPADKPIRAFLLHCVDPAHEGGANQFLDHEILYGLLRRDPNIDVDALFCGDAFAIPANMDQDTELRERFEGAVFDVDGEQLRMRFSARQRNIEWNADPRVLTAMEAMKYYLNHSSLVLTARLQRGMGVISRNVLHRRESFVDARGQRRLFLRARYHDAIERQVLTGNRDALAK